MSVDIHSDRILILDFGSQYTQLIARRVREAGVYCELHSWEIDEADIREFNPSGIILSGGPESTTADDAPVAAQVVFELGVPVLGICYGMQTMSAQLGGKVENADHHEYGYAQVRARGHTALLKEIEDHTSDEGYGLLDVWMSHGDHVIEMPKGFKLMASTESAPIAGIADEECKFYGLQFHLEVDEPMIMRWLKTPSMAAEALNFGGPDVVEQIAGDTSEHIEHSVTLGNRLFSEFIRLSRTRARKKSLPSR